ncbi:MULTISPECIES: tRNA pseudouridine(55) synthase TruB [Eisenbergiella]|uniref:tRNA pseudouridine synthase B n=1 Tax=Eisenbergiella porci TaxID=2652274 RepID=A0A6N7WKR2_9FIRM|nr:MULTISPECIES: tRNA pseudouridine(55) synthase TruB [Eisenbergiella]MDY2652057.1 tRNA pseudouridine(55) synthase TruB [Eisenbergiella porci]MSS90304.1 tRNA pseudouridine(55) synthase TruB [Eisenbergiella porci]
MINGILNVYKEAGFTSHDVVAKLRGICRQKKIGHTGTLDPEAVGVLPVCLGSGTKLCDMLTDKSKEYEAVLLLGQVTDTQDVTGTVLEEHEVTADEEQAVEAIRSFVGAYEQIPPMYSALKVNGKRLYELARAGKEVERKGRRVEIHSIEILSVSLPEITFRVACSKGTYIRTLCHDIGQKLGCGGTMKSLKRTRVGIFTIDGTLKLSQLEELAAQGRLEEKVIPVEAMFTELPVLTVKDAFVRLIENGNAFYPGQAEESVRTPDGRQVRVYDRKGRFYGIYAFSEEKERYQPVKMFL